MATTLAGHGTRHRRTRRAPHAVVGSGWPSRRLYAGRRNALAAQRAFFSAHATRQVAMRCRLEPWLGGAAMMACAATWGLLLMLLGA